MFQVGDRVVYSIHGVCEIKDSETHKVDGKKVTYLVLEPMGQRGSRYMVPTHNAVAMGKVKRMLTREELECMMHSEEVHKDCWISDEGVRKQTYRELISSGEREKIMAMVHTLYRHRAEQIAAGKKVHLCDDNFMRDAEKLLVSEVSYVMEMDSDTAKESLRSWLKND